MLNWRDEVIMIVGDGLEKRTEEEEIKSTDDGVLAQKRTLHELLLLL